MAQYRCPNCNDEVELGGFARVTWCGACGQPLTLLDLLPVRPATSPAELQVDASPPEEPAALA